MEEHATDSCNIIYFCANDEDDVYELYHKRSPPEASATKGEKQSRLEETYHNVRALLDEDQGGFDEVFICSRSDQCLERLESYANSSPTLVLIEQHSLDASTKPHDSVLDRRKEPSAFLRTLGADIRGARFQQPVLPFVLLSSDHPQQHDSNTDSGFTAESLSVGAVDIIQSPLQHEDINHLIGHLKDKVRPPARLIAAQMAYNLVDSIHDRSEPKIAFHRPDLHLSDERRMIVESAVRKWLFPASDFNMDELTYAAMFMLEHLLKAPELEAYALPRDKLISFLLATRRQYKHEREVHYHNWRHAVDVTQSIYCFLLDIRLCPPAEEDDRPHKELNAIERMITHLDGLILLVSGIGHDVGHPGVNNAFLVAVNHPLAQTYNDRSVLENYHCAAYSQLLRRHWPALHNTTGFRATMISTILATDMQRHFEYMKSMKDLKAQTESSDGKVEDWSDQEKQHARELIMALMMKAADISNVARPFEVSSNWAKILMNEFARQGELESELDIPTCLFGGPPDKGDFLAAAQSQKGFMGLFGYPLFQGIAEIMPSVSCAVSELEKNQVIWDGKIEEEKERRKPSGDEGHLTFSSVTAEEVDEALGHRNSDPRIVPAPVPQSPSKETSRIANMDGGISPTKHGAHELRQNLTHGFPATNDRSASQPVLSSYGAPLSPVGASSRRSSKDVALDQLQQLTAFAHQNLSPTPSSRRGSSDAGWQIQQSYPGSRRGSKDESLTTILVTSGGTPNRKSSPSSPGKTSSPGKHSAKRQSMQQGQKNATARTSAPSSRSHAASTGTATTTQHSLTSTQTSTQPSSDEGGDYLATKHHKSIPSTEDPFMVPGNWPNTLDGSHRLSPPEGSTTILPDTPPTPPLLTKTLSEDSRTAQRKPSGLRESRSRSRLRSLKFWKKKRDSPPTSAASGEGFGGGVESGAGSP